MGSDEWWLVHHTTPVFWMWNWVEGAGNHKLIHRLCPVSRLTHKETPASTHHSSSTSSSEDLYRQHVSYSHQILIQSISRPNSEAQITLRSYSRHSSDNVVQFLHSIQFRLLSFSDTHPVQWKSLLVKGPSFKDMPLNSEIHAGVIVSLNFHETYWLRPSLPSE